MSRPLFTNSQSLMLSRLNQEKAKPDHVFTST